MRLFLLFVFVLMFSQVFISSAQTIYNGKEFHVTLGGFSYLSISDRYCDKAVIAISSKHNATVQFRYTLNGTIDVYNVQAGVPKFVFLDTARTRWISNILVETVNKNSLAITSDSNITIQLANRQIKAEDAMTVLPYDVQDYGTEYYLLGLKGGAGSNFGVFAFSVVANCDSVELEITPSAQTYSHPAGIPFTIWLNKGETYELGTPYQSSSGKDISGTHIKVKNAKCCFPINVYMNYPTVYSKYPQVTNTLRCCADYVFEQLFPVEWWSNRYALVPFYRNPQSMLRIISAFNNNRVFFNNMQVKILNRGQIFDTVIGGATIVTADSAVGIGHFMLSDFNDNIPNNGDPAMLWCVPMDRGVSEAYIPLFRPLQPLSQDEHFLTVISETANASSVMLNGNPIASQFQPFPSGTYQYAHIPLDTSTNYHLKANQPVTAFYGVIYVQGSYLLPLADVGYSSSSVPDTTFKESVFCEDSTILLEGSKAADIYEWSTGATTPQITASSGGTYVLKETIACPTKVRYYMFSIKTFRFDDVFHDTVICNGDSFRFQHQPVNDVTIRWTPATGVSDTTVINPVITVDTTTIYTIVASRIGCPDLKKSFTVYVEPVPVVVLGADTAVCVGDSVKLVSLVKPEWFSPYSYNWQPAANLSPGAPGEVLFTGLHTTTVVLTVSTQAGCKGSDNIVIRTIKHPELIVTPDFIAKYGDVVQLNATGAYYYTWLPSRLLDYPNESDPKATATDTATFQVIGMDQYGCRDTAYVRMDIDYTMFEMLPTAFSPNGDGRNDVFRIINLKYQRLLEFRIFNRWGQNIFYTTDPKDAWDGTFLGEPQEIGTYFYLIRISTPDGKQRTYKGDVLLVR